MSLPPFSLDKIRGMLIGLAVGDALGALYDVYQPDLANYTGYLQGNISKAVKGKGTFTLPAGTLTDVTELAILNARSMLLNPSYPWQRSNVLTNYLNWAATNPLWMDSEMEKYFKGIKSIKGYEDRIRKDYGLIPPITNTSMYRVVPLTLIRDNVYAYEDCKITHYSDLVYDTTILYVTALRLALWDVDINDILNTLMQKSQHQIPIDAITVGLNGTLTNISGRGRSDCFNILYLLALCREATSFQQAMDFLITSFPQTETRANCGLIGAFFGAYFGFDALNLEEKTSYNISVVLRNVSSRPSHLTLGDFDTLCSNLHRSYSG